MAIYKVGQRFRYHNILKRRGNKRSVMAVLSLTAMVDMFTVLAIFLLQSYNTTGEIIHLPKEVLLPKANQVIELKPSVVLTISKDFVMVENEVVAKLSDVKMSTDWAIPSLKEKTKLLILKAKTEYEAKAQNKISKAIQPTLVESTDDSNSWKKVTIQADKSIDYLTIKKIMYTVYEAGGGPINFAVSKEVEDNNAQFSQEN